MEIKKDTNYTNYHKLNSNLYYTNLFVFDNSYFYLTILKVNTINNYIVPIKNWYYF